MWGAVEADFHREYGIDISARGLLRSKTWRWFVVRLSHLSPESATRHAVSKKKKNTDPGAAMQALAAAANR
jgi:hypothetical protein